MVARSSCISQVNTVTHGGQIIVFFSSQHSDTWWSGHRAFHQLLQYHMVVRSSCIPQVSTVPHGGQVIVYSTSCYSTIWWSGHRAFHQSTVPHGCQVIVHFTSQQYHMVVRSSCHSTSQQYHMVVRSSRIPLLLSSFRLFETSSGMNRSKTSYHFTHKRVHTKQKSKR